MTRIVGDSHPIKWKTAPSGAWQTLGYDDSSFATGSAGAAGFGSAVSATLNVTVLAYDVVWRTTIPINTDHIVIRYPFTLTAGELAGGVRLSTHLDNGSSTWVNGVKVAEGFNFTGAYVSNDIDVTAQCVVGANVAVQDLASGNDEPNGGAVAALIIDALSVGAWGVGQVRMGAN